MKRITHGKLGFAKVFRQGGGKDSKRIVDIIIIIIIHAFRVRLIMVIKMTMGSHGRTRGTAKQEEGTLVLLLAGRCSSTSTTTGGWRLLAAWRFPRRQGEGRRNDGLFWSLFFSCLPMMIARGAPAAGRKH